MMFWDEGFCQAAKRRRLLDEGWDDSSQSQRLPLSSDEADLLKQLSMISKVVRASGDRKHFSYLQGVRNPRCLVRHENDLGEEGVYVINRSHCQISCPVVFILCRFN